MRSWRERAEKAEQQLEEAQKNERRYLWLRQAGWIDDAIMDANDIWDDKPESLDAAIDRAIDRPATAPESTDNQKSPKG